MKPAYFIIWVSFNINFRFSIKWCSRAQKVIEHKFVKYTCSMETVQQNGRLTLFSSKFPSNIFSILYVSKTNLFEMETMLSSLERMVEHDLIVFHYFCFLVGNL